MAFTTPALANSSAAAADVTASLRAAQVAKAQTQTGDEEFRKLFSSWKSLDKPGLAASSAAATVGTGFRPTTVSIPSRMPVIGAALTSGYGMRWHPVLGGRRAHKGIDLAMPIGTPVYATADAVVSKAERFSSYGLFISLEHGGEIQTRYGHLSRIAVAAGQTVHKGDLIGYVGSTGRSTGPHLHYEVRVGGVAVNPVPYLQGEGHPNAQLASASEDGAMGDGDE
ncbi:MAG: M23 family metallopeptidase [Proteobacteria bacterium]|nr:M23 family metallopeptidase [Pseudomonadota bacterium]MDE2412378.1 M23 family metallopeptidase [Sphingomonadales bacterium]